MLPFLAIAAALAALLAPTPSGWVESAYSNGVYAWLQRVLTPLSNRVPIALADPLLLVGLIGLVGWWAVRLRRARGRRLRAVARLLRDTAAAAAILYLAFLLVWGLNYRRVPLKEKLDFEAEAVTGESVARLARRAAARLDELYEPARQEPWPPVDRLPAALAPAFDAAQRQLGASRPAVPGRPKASLLGAYLRWSAIDGLMNPFGLEVLLNPDMLPFERPFTLAHEWAHLAGYADESEASFVAWLTCLRGDAQARYSGWLFLYAQLAWALPADERRALAATVGPGPRADLEAIDRRYRRSVPAVRRTVRRAYDGFLKANRVEAGVRSYAEVVELLLGTTIGRNLRERGTGSQGGQESPVS